MCYDKYMRNALLLALLIVGCKGEVGDICTEKSECAGELCIALTHVAIEQCSQECPCADGEKCEGGFCTIPCSESDLTCPDRLVCYTDYRQCLPICETDDDCSQAFSCVEGMCL